MNQNNATPPATGRTPTQFPATQVRARCDVGGEVCWALLSSFRFTGDGDAEKRRLVFEFVET